MTIKIKFLKSIKSKVGDLLTAPMFALILKFPAIEPFIIRLLAAFSHWSVLQSFHSRIRNALREHVRGTSHSLRVVCLPSKTKMIIDISGLLGCLYFESKPYESKTTRFVLNNLNQGDVFIDIGAHSGYFSLLAAGLVGNQGKVYAFEPNPMLQNHLKGSIRLNSFEERIILSSVALSDTDKDNVDFFLSNLPGNNGISTLTPWEGHLAKGRLSDENKVCVQTLRFDTWIEDVDIQRIDMIKVDVENAEEKVLLGMEKTLRLYCPRYIIVETASRGRVQMFLEQHGYDAYHLELADKGWRNILFSLRDGSFPRKLS